MELLGGIGCSVDNFGDEDANKQPATADEAVEKFDGRVAFGRDREEQG